MKHEYLIELLKQNKTVILPNIGAFSNNTNPQHPFLFNEFLKFNDGMMAKHIASKEGISMDAAGATIDKFTNELKTILAEGKEVVIPGIGTLQTKDGKTILSHGSISSSTPSPEKKIEPAIEKKLEPIIETVIVPVIEKKPEPILEKKVDPIIEKKIEPVVEKKPEPIIEKAIVPEVEKKAEPVIEKKPETIVEKVVVPVVEKKIEPVIEKKPEPIIEKKVEPLVEKKIETKPETLKQVQSDSTNKTEPKPKKKKRKLIWILLILLILGGGGTAGFLYKDELMKMMGMGGEEKTAEKKSGENDKKENETTSEEKNPEEKIVSEETTPDTSKTETPIVEEVIEEPKEEIKIEQVVEENKTAPLTAENSTPGNYYVIVGCFQESTNAENMSAKISSAGLTPTNVGTFNGLAHIAAGSASDLQGAIQQANAIKGTFSKVWILKR